MQITATEMIAASNTVAEEYAAARAAEMVGMRRTESGKLIENPNAEWAISDTTRDELRTIVRDAFETETPLPTLIDKIKAAGAFSNHRAAMIARTEVQTAQSAGNFDIWKTSGVVTGTKWFPSADHTEECECEPNFLVTVPFGELFPSGDFYPPVHPHCECVVAAVSFVE